MTVMVEFINTCPTCVSYENMVNEVARQYGDEVQVKFYYAGKDMDYIKKYGMISKGTLIINEKKKYDSLNYQVIKDAIAKAVKEGRSS